MAAVTVTGHVTIDGVTYSPTATYTAAPSVQPPYVGAATQSNGDPASLEAAAGRKLGVRRTYWNLGTSGDSLAKSIVSARADSVAGRIPWISHKFRTDWASVANGADDAPIDQLNAAIATMPGTVWVALHHEPEGDGTLSDWVAAQLHCLPRFTAPNVRTSIILTAYDTFYSGNSSQGVAALIDPLVGVVDILGFDAYNPYGSTGHVGKDFFEMGAHWYDKIAPVAQARGLDWAIAETGYTDEAATLDSAWLTRGFDDMAGRTDRPGLALCYWNAVTSPSNGSWALNSVKTPKFTAILNRSR